MATKIDKKFEKQSGGRRVFSESFKKMKVKELIEKRIKISELCRLYSVSRTSVYNWIDLYSQTPKGVVTVVQMESESKKTKVLLQRLSEYERIIGQKQMLIDFLEKSFELASKELGYDVKKKYAAKPWSGSEEIKETMAIE